MAAEDDGGFQVQQSRTKGSKKRLYIGNLPQSDNVKAKLADFIDAKTQLGVSKDDVTIVRQGAAALVACQDMNRAISMLNNVDFEGNKLVVEREKKKRPNNGTKKPSFGGGWKRPTRMSAPSPSRPKEEPKIVKDNKKELLDEEDGEIALFDNELELSQHIGSIVASELKAAEEDGDVVNTAIASTAAMTLLSSTDAFGLAQSNNDANNDAATEEPVQTTKPGDDERADKSNFDFQSQSKKPLSDLLADYGEQDLDFKKVVPTMSAEQQAPKTADKSKREDYNNRLTLQGKAPIHVEVTSFGYTHGVPPELRSGGWSHAHPLAPMDCRDLPQVPQYMMRQDGLSPAVKRVLRNTRDKDDDTKRDNSVQECANDLGRQMFDALHEAITAGGYGHASPLRMTVHVGSEAGRHRSVVVCELAATALRKLLRSNKDNRITQPVSVGTRHRDIERRQQQREAARRPSKQPQSKQKEFESEW